MTNVRPWLSVVLGVTTLGMSLAAQESSLLDPQGIRQALASDRDKTMTGDATPKPAEAVKPPPVDPEAEVLLKQERLKLAQELKALKAKEGGPRRFAADLFDTREELPSGTEGGIAEDYVLGIGDQLQLLGFGSATFEVPAAVNGRGEVLIPKVGTVKVSGMTLGRARSAIQGKVNQQLAGTTVDVSVTKLRQVRIFVLGEVYKPGSYLVPSLSSLVSVLGLTGGPTALGSYRQVRVLRGGQVIHQVDLYPLRAEGLGNLNFSLQTGDTLFVPLAFNQVLLEGSFVRVAGAEANLQLARTAPSRTSALKAKELAAKEPGPESPGAKETLSAGILSSLSKEAAKPAPKPAAKPEAAPEPPPEGALPSDQDTPLPTLLFEFLPGETAKDALRFSGGLLPKAYGDGLTLRREDPSGATSLQDFAPSRAEAVPLLRGDVLSALPRRDRTERMVTLAGWVRVPGPLRPGRGPARGRPPEA